MRATQKIEFLPQINLSNSMVFPDWMKYSLMTVLTLVIISSFFGVVVIRYNNMNLQLSIAKSFREYSELVQHNQMLTMDLHKLNQYERIYTNAYNQKMRLPEVPEPIIVSNY
jgi:cell division protein FtsL